MTTVLLIRHGETDANRNGVFQGQAGAGLNLKGREQARRLAERLVATDCRIDYLYTSDLQRAAETADIIGAYLNKTPLPDAGLREIYLGTWQGLSKAQVSDLYPEQVAAWLRGEDVRRGGGENYADLQVRMTTTLRRLVERHPGATLGVVSHGAAIKLFIAGVLGITTDYLPYFHVVFNTGVSVLRFSDQGRWDLMLWNDSRHLPHDPLAGAMLEDA